MTTKLTTPEERAGKLNDYAVHDCTCSVCQARRRIIIKEIRAALKELVEEAIDSSFGPYEVGYLKEILNEVLPEEEKIK